MEGTRFSGKAVSAAILISVLAACSSSPAPDVAPDPYAAVSSAATRIDSAGILGHVAFLASDELAGRDTPSPGLEAAAEYIARRFEALGLTPAGDDGDWLQRYPYLSASFDAESSRLTAEGDGGGATLAFGEQWFAMPVGPDHERLRAGAVYGGAVGDHAYPPEAEGRIVAVTSGPGLGMELFAEIGYAVQSGAAGLLIILNPAIPSEAIPSIAGQVRGLPAQDIPVLGVLRSAAADLFTAAGQEIDLVAPVEGSGTPMELSVDLTVRVAMDREEFEPPNVAALLPGSDPALRASYVVYTAHFDHVGIGTPDAEGDSIYNGADDDASGTALVLEVAEAFASLPEPPKRSVLFLAVSGEEKGLLGANYWAENPTVPIEGVIANINADMVGRNAPDTLIAIGGEYSSLGPLSEQVAAALPELGLVIAPDPDPSENAFFRSDHVAFVRKQVPAVFYTTWLHEDYHAPSDEVEAIDVDKLTRVSRLAFRVGWEVAQNDIAPAWNPGAWDEVSRILEESPF
ncbi:MAG: M28 family peptidase [Gemmatimonadota bacterium]